MREIQNAHLALTYQTLQGMKEEDDPFVYGQAHHYLALGALYSQATPTAIAYHEEAVKIVERNGLHVLRDTGHMISDPGHLEASDILERTVFLGTLLHTEIVLEMFGAKKRTLCYKIEDELCYRFPVRQPHFNSTFVLIVFSNAESVSVPLPGFTADLEGSGYTSVEASIGHD